MGKRTTKASTQRFDEEEVLGGDLLEGPSHSEMSAMTRMWEGKTNPHGGTRPFHKKPPFAKRKFEETTPNFSKLKMKESQRSSSKKSEDERISDVFSVATKGTLCQRL